MKKTFVLSFLLVTAILSFSFALELPSLDKPKVRLAIPPGETGFGEITLENRSSYVRTVKAYLEDWRYSSGGDGAKDFFAPNTLPLSASSWISFSPAEFNIPPFGRKTVSFSVKVPPSAKSGGYYSVLFFETVFQPQSDNLQENMLGAGIGLNIRIGSLFYIEVTGGIKREVSLENLMLKQDQKKLTLEVDLLNSGNVDITAATSYHIMSKEGIVVARGEFNDAYTFANDRVKLFSSWHDSLKPGQYSLVITCDIGKALEDTNFGRGPVVVKEATFEVNSSGQITQIGRLQ